jgi:PKD repeat protein
LKLLSLKKKNIPKVAALTAGLVAALVVATINPIAAQATPRASSCNGCHASDTGNFSTVTAVPSTATPAAGATYTVAINMSANPNGGNAGFGIQAIAPTPAPTTIVRGGPSATTSFTATMIAPAAAGTYSYTVWTNQGIDDPSVSLTGSKVFTITVPGAPVAVTTTTALAVTPASPVVAPGSPTLTATVTGAGAAGTVQFLNGTTVLGTSTVAAGRATLALTGLAAGSYSYTANFIPTSAAAFTPSTSSAVAYVVTVPVPVVVTTTTALTMAPIAATAVAPAAKTLTAAVSGAGAAGTVQFFNGTASLGSSPLASGSASLALTAIAAGSYSYHAVFTPTSAALFTSSTSANLAFTVTAAPLPAPTAAFNASAISGTTPFALTVTDTSTGAPTSWLWTFGNGATSNVKNPPVVTYTVAGTYTVTLVASNASGASAPVSKTITVTDPAPAPAPTASFTASAATGTFPLTVGLTDTSTGSPTSWLWTLGNGGTSNLQSPSVTYTAAGSYTVTLIASNASGASALVSKTITVTAPSTSTAKISYLSPNHGQVGTKVTIIGSGFGTSGVVKLGTSIARVSSWTSTRIVITVPWGHYDHSALVTVTPTGATASNAAKFSFGDGDDGDNGHHDD